MNRGYIRLWRKTLDGGLLQQHKIWVLFSYCLLKATYKRRKVIHGGREILLEPGQFIFGRRVASEETGLTEREIRTALASLIALGILTSKTTNRFSIITIVNWQTYQAPEAESDQQNDQRPTSTRPQTRIKEGKKKITPEEFQEAFAYLLDRYPDRNLIDQTLQAMASTRETNRIADTVKLSILQAWEKYPVEQVQAGIRIYLEKGYAGQRKSEKYLLGIIRNQTEQRSKGQDQGASFKTTGSALLDDALKNPERYRPVI
jgi:hypothetical protein